MAEPPDEYAQAAEQVTQGLFGAPKLVHRNDTPLIMKRARLPDPDQIPPRQWLFGTMLIRGFVTVLVAPGGTGKSVLAMTAALSLCTGINILQTHVWERTNVCVINEDPMEELERRLAAIVIRHKVDPTEVEGRYFMNSMDERTVIMATRGPDSFTVIHPDEEALVAQLLANGIGLLVVDPYAESHTLEENSNPDMVAAAGAWRRVARRANCAVLLIHHVRKGPGEGGIDAARGAKGLTDSARVGLIMTPMSEKEAEDLNVPPEDRFKYVRLDDGKVNLSPRTDKAKWFRMDTVNLGNATPLYPHGDNVAALVPWAPPKLFAATSVAQINAALDAIAQGPEAGILYAPKKQGGTDRWVGNPVMLHCEVEEPQAKQMVAAWLKSELLTVTKFYHPGMRRETAGVVVDDTKRPSE